MPIVVKAVSPEVYAAWVAEQGGTMPEQQQAALGLPEDARLQLAKAD
jgi:cytochrome c oxidase subunit 2